MPSGSIPAGGGPVDRLLVTVARDGTHGDA
jgi:hypothetical protein